MKKLFLIITIFALMITLQNCINKNIKTTNNESAIDSKKNNFNDTIPRVTGIGGIFFKSKNPKELNNWYGENLGLALNPYGSAFEFRNARNPIEINYLQWSLFNDSTNYFLPSEKEFMINYRVNNISGLVRKLKKNGTIILDSIEEYEYGKFVHIMDPDGNKIELWEPVDSVLTNMGGPTTK